MEENKGGDFVSKRQVCGDPCPWELDMMSPTDLPLLPSKYMHYHAGDTSSQGAQGLYLANNGGLLPPMSETSAALFGGGEQYYHHHLPSAHPQPPFFPDVGNQQVLLGDLAISSSSSRMVLNPGSTGSDKQFTFIPTPSLTPHQQLLHSSHFLPAMGYNNNHQIAAMGAAASLLSHHHQNNNNSRNNNNNNNVIYPNHMINVSSQSQEVFQLPQINHQYYNNYMAPPPAMNAAYGSFSGLQDQRLLLTSNPLAAAPSNYQYALERRLDLADPRPSAYLEELSQQVRDLVDRRVYRCTTCFLEFPNAQAFGGHMSSHSKSKKVRCSEAGAAPAASSKRPRIDPLVLGRALASPAGSTGISLDRVGLPGQLLKAMKSDIRPAHEKKVEDQVSSEAAEKKKKKKKKEEFKEQEKNPVVVKIKEEEDGKITTPPTFEIKESCIPTSENTTVAVDGIKENNDADDECEKDQIHKHEVVVADENEKVRINNHDNIVADESEEEGRANRHHHHVGAAANDDECKEDPVINIPHVKENEEGYASDKSVTSELRSSKENGTAN